MYNSFITLLTHTSIGNTSNLFNVENNKIQSATFGPTPDKLKSSSLTSCVFGFCSNFFKSTFPSSIVCVVSYSLISLNPRPNSLYLSTLTFFNSSGVGNV